FELSQPSCNLENGAIVASVTGGVPPYSFSWEGRTETDSTLSGLAEGSYTFQVTDVNGCEVSSTATLSNTGLPIINATQVNATCGSADGSLYVTVAGVNPPFTFSWEGPEGFVSSSDSISGLSTGTYTV